MNDGFELRWLERVVPNSITVSQGIAHDTTERVLQFRTREGPRGESWWGEWQDVPVEIETVTG